MQPTPRIPSNVHNIYVQKCLACSRQVYVRGIISLERKHNHAWVPCGRGVRWKPRCGDNSFGAKWNVKLTSQSDCGKMMAMMAMDETFYLMVLDRRLDTKVHPTVCRSRTTHFYRHKRSRLLNVDVMLWSQEASEQFQFEILMFLRNYERLSFEWLW